MPRFRHLSIVIPARAGSTIADYDRDLQSGRERNELNLQHFGMVVAAQRWRTGAHLHGDNDAVFYVPEGTISFLVGDEWKDAQKGAFLRIPAKTIHDLKNTAGEKAGALNFSFAVVSNGIRRQSSGGLEQ